MPQPRNPRTRRRGVAIVSSLALVVGACGGGDGDPVETVATTEPAPPAGGDPADEASDAAPTEQDPGEDASPPQAPTGPNDLPAVVVRDIATGDEVDLSALAPGELPFVVWFWAPH